MDLLSPLLVPSTQNTQHVHPSSLEAASRTLLMRSAWKKHGAERRVSQNLIYVVSAHMCSPGRASRNTRDTHRLHLRRSASDVASRGRLEEAAPPVEAVLDIDLLHGAETCRSKGHPGAQQRPSGVLLHDEGELMGNLCQCVPHLQDRETTAANP